VGRHQVKKATVMCAGRVDDTIRSLSLTDTVPVQKGRLFRVPDPEAVAKADGIVPQPSVELVRQSHWRGRRVPYSNT